MVDAQDVGIAAGLAVFGVLLVLTLGGVDESVIFDTAVGAAVAGSFHRAAAGTTAVFTVFGEKVVIKHELNFFVLASLNKTWVIAPAFRLMNTKNTNI